MTTTDPEGVITIIFYEGHKVYMNGEYPAICLDNKNVHVHRLEWERHHGSIPKGYIIHHVDGDKMNWNIDNLVMLSRSDHIKEHKDRVHRKGVKVIAKKNGVTLHFDSIEHAAKACGTYPSGIQNVCKGVQRYANGWTFRKVGGQYPVLRF